MVTFTTNYNEKNNDTCMLITWCKSHLGIVQSLILKPISGQLATQQEKTLYTGKQQQQNPK